MKKYWLTLALILIAAIGKSQNPTIIVAGTNITISPSSGVGKVTINATGGGGLTPTTVTNITSSTLTVTGQGSNVINLEAPASGSGTVTNVLTDFPWLTTSGAGTAVITISTNAVKIPSGNLEPMVLTNLTLANTPYLSLSGVGTSTITITGLGTVITNNSSPTFVTVNGLTPANFVTNISNTVPALTVSGTGGNSYTITPNGTIVTNNASPTFVALNGLTPANFATNISTTVPWLTVTGAGGNSYNFATNSTKIPIGNVDLSNVALLNADNTFTANNYFTNNFPVFGTNVVFSYAEASGKSVQAHTSAGGGYFVFNNLGTGTAYYGFGDPAVPTRYARFQYDTSGNVDIRLGSSMGFFGVFDDSLGGRPFEIDGTGGVTLGFNASSAHIINGSTLTTAHELNWNSGVWRIPTATTGTVTNNAGSGNGIGASFLNGIIASNLVARTTDGTSRIDSGTNQTLRIIANNSAGVIQTEGLFTSRTNTLTAALPVVNAIYTNNGLRMDLVITATFAAGGDAEIFSILGTTTQYFSRIRMPVACTNSMYGKIQPLALYGVTNYAGTVTPHPGKWNEVRE